MTRSRTHGTVEADSSATGRRYWRSLEELADDAQFAATLHREFPEFANRLVDEPTRRRFLQLMGASVALAGVNGCVQQPQETIVAYVRPPEDVIPGKPLYYATAMTHDGAGVGLLGETHMGRPVKMEGNPLHPAVPALLPRAERAEEHRVQFGPTDAFAQAIVLSLYDPDRSQTVRRGALIDTWDGFVTALRQNLEQIAPNGGRGLRILSETVVSPTLANQLQQLTEQLPQAVWHQWEAVNRDNERLGHRLAFGADYSTVYHVERADVVVSLDADFLTEGPWRLQNARGFAHRRRFTRDQSDDSPPMNRLYVVETSATLTGAAADHRLGLPPTGVLQFAESLAAALGLELPVAANSNGPSVPAEWLSAVAEDLRAARGRCLVLAGRAQPPVVHALAHWINQSLDNIGQTIEYFPPVDARPVVETESLTELVRAMRAGEVEMLVILGGNPVYDAPADLDFVGALKDVPFTAHLSPYFEETSGACHWHVPETHLLETWSDTRAADGTASIVQPLIAPLYAGKTVHEFIGAVAGTPEASSYDLVRQYWERYFARTEAGAAESLTADFEQFWKISLHDGIVPESRFSAESPNLQGDLAAALAEAQAVLPSPEGIQLSFRPDPSVWDGRFANNGWLRELPRPLTKLTWDNAALVSPATAEDNGLETRDVIEITRGETRLRMPVFILPGQPDHVVALSLGYGQRQAGRVAEGVGVNVYPLRTTDALWFANATIRKTGEAYELATTQHHHVLAGRPIVRAGTLAEYQANPEHPPFMTAEHGATPDASLYPEYEYDGYKWGMSVNQSACIGCNACVIACQAENNIPIVGKEGVARGREMHWLRIDHYYEGETESPKSYHQPMMCVHCELAPCEPVCPVAATTHSSEGLNEMIYNRCVGTRYCSNNCPYKVRRFNFLDYNQELRKSPTLQLLPNPDVTVRTRGVMEKCTYCVQRISAARIEAEKEGRTIRDGEVVTACQAACPTAAIVFGDMNDPNSAVVRAKQSSLTYSVLGELNTRPRTTHIAAIRNPHPAWTSASPVANEPAH